MERFTAAGLAGRIAVALLASPVAWASTYIVDDDDGPGVDFTDIPPAIAAASAGDILLVRPGHYSAFTLDKGVAILGTGGVDVDSLAAVDGLAAGQLAILTSLAVPSIRVTGCMGTVVVQAASGVEHVSVVSSADVRLAGFAVRNAPAPGLPAIGATQSRVELVDAPVHGAFGAGSVDGDVGIEASNGARVHAVRFSAIGGQGSFLFQPAMQASDGAPGVRIDATSTVVAHGPDGLIGGGNGGLNLYYSTDCSWDGTGSCGVEGAGTLVHSGTRAFGGYTDTSFHCNLGYQAPGFCASTRIAELPAGASLAMAGTPTPGGTVTFTVTGEPGGAVNLALGSRLIVRPSPGVQIEQLVRADRTFELGAIPASGRLQSSFTIPVSLAPGAWIGAQARVTHSTGLQRTNSVVIVVP